MIKTHSKIQGPEQTGKNPSSKEEPFWEGLSHKMPATKAPGMAPASVAVEVAAAILSPLQPRNKQLQANFSLFSATIRKSRATFLAGFSSDLC